MLKRINLPIPQFLQRFDRYLLLHHPDIWSSRIHIVFFYGGALLLSVVLHALVRPLALDDMPNMDRQFMLATIPSLLAFGPFVYHISTYSVEKRFGQRGRGFSAKQQLTIAFSIFLLAIIPFLYANILTDRIANTISNEELSEDIRSLDIGDVYFPAYTYVFKDYVKKDGTYNYRMHKYRLYGQGYNLAVWSSGDTYRVYTSGEKYQLSSYHRRNTHNREQREQQAADFIQAFNKYSPRKISLTGEAALSYFNLGMIGVKNIKPDKLMVDTNLGRILHAKESQFDFQKSGYLGSIGLFLMGLWLVLMFFIKMRIRDFLLGIVAGTAIAMIFYGGIDAITSWADILPGVLLFPLFSGLFIFLFIQVISSRNSKSSLSWKTISLMWVSSMIPLFPLLLVSWSGPVRFVTAQTLLYLGFGILVLCWNLFLNKQFTSFLARPTEN